MINTFEPIYADISFRLSTLTFTDWVDLLLVAVTFYLLLNLIRRSQAAFLLRGLLILATVLFVTTVLLPLPTFDIIIRGAILVLLIAVPITLQPEIRRWLEKIGRNAALTRTARHHLTERVIPPLLRAVENLARTKTGALIILEGENSLEDVAASGITVGGKVTGELLQTIFHDKTPLHDGAVILRGDQVLAASCVLPLTKQQLEANRRLGTRHRAAVGMSEAHDALVIVVSEETGVISVAYQGVLRAGLDSASLRQHIFDFYAGERPSSPSVSRTQPRRLSWPSVRRLIGNFLYLIFSLILALIAWVVVIEQTNPTEHSQIERIPLRLENMPAGMSLTTAPPDTISVEVQTTADIRQTLSPESFQAILPFPDDSAGIQRLSIQVTTSAAPLRILRVIPPTLDLELVPIISATLPVVVEVTDQPGQSVVYEQVGAPLSTPAEVQVIAPAHILSRVSQIRATISLANATSSIREIRPLQAVDENGRILDGITIEPAQAQITILVRRRQDARDVGVQAVLDGTPPPGYWVSGISVSPTNVTLRGEPEQLLKMESFVPTLPVDVSKAVDVLEVQIPLDLPADIRAVDADGNPITSVVVTTEIAARTGDVLIKRPITLINTREGTTVVLEPVAVDLLLSGPIPTLTEIENSPDLVQVVIDVDALPLGENQFVAPELILPSKITAQLTQSTVLVTVTRE